MNNIWTDEELMFALYLYFKRNEGLFLDRDDLEYHVDMMNKYCKKNRTYDSVILRFANYKYLDTGKGMSHTGRALEIWNQYCNDLESLEENYKNIMTPFEDRKEELVKFGSEKGFLTLEEILEYLSDLELTEENVDDLYNALNDLKIEVISEVDDSKEDIITAFDEHLKNKGYILSQNEKEIYINLFKSLGELTNNKLNYKDIIEKYDEISDQMKLLPKKDKIRIPYYDLDEAFNNILTKEEKEYFLFATWYGECVTIADESSGSTIFKNGNTDLVSVEAIVNLKNNYYEDDIHYDMFHFDEKEEPRVSGSFGYSQTNPINTTSIKKGYAYLESLKTAKGNKVNYNRVGSVSVNGFDNPIDEYELYENLFLGRKKLIGNIYINSYSNENSKEAPEGLII